MAHSGPERRVTAVQGLSQVSGEIEVATPGAGFLDATPALQRWLHEAGAVEGLLTVFIRHTSASLVVQENADPDVRHDLLTALDHLAPQGRDYRHDSEGPDDMPAHIRSMVTAVSLSVPVLGGRMRLGTWQAVYVAEHRSAPHRRRLALHFMGSIV